MGNICRSPTAEGVFTQAVEHAGLNHKIEIDSAGTHAYHVGEPPDGRATEAASQRGIDLSTQRARRVHSSDFEKFDIVLAMDDSNLTDLQAICPAEHQNKLHLFMDFANDASQREVPDPYYGGAHGFERVLDMVEAASKGLLSKLRNVNT